MGNYSPFTNKRSRSYTFTPPTSPGTTVSIYTNPKPSFIVVTELERQTGGVGITAFLTVSLFSEFKSANLDVPIYSAATSGNTETGLWEMSVYIPAGEPLRLESYDSTSGSSSSWTLKYDVYDVDD